MSPQHKNKRRFIVLMALIGLSLLLHFVLQGRKSTISPDISFAVADTAAVDKIVIHQKEHNNTLTKLDSGWVVNDKFKADPQIMRVLLSVLHRVRISRGSAKAQEENIVGKLRDNGNKVEIYHGNQLMESFYSGGNATKTTAYFMDDKNKNAVPYVVGLPGYDSYVSGIFEIPEIDWRDRLIFASSWRSIKKLSMEYPKNPGDQFIIQFDFNFLKMPGISRLDTTKMMNYLQQFQYFQADRFVANDQEKDYDSLRHTVPFAILSIEDIDHKKSHQITFYPKPNNGGLMLGALETGQLAQFDYNRIKTIFRKKSYFEAEEKKK